MGLAEREGNAWLGGLGVDAAPARGCASAHAAALPKPHPGALSALAARRRRGLSAGAPEAAGVNVLGGHAPALHKSSNASAGSLLSTLRPLRALPNSAAADPHGAGAAAEVGRARSRRPPGSRSRPPRASPAERQCARDRSGCGGKAGPLRAAGWNDGARKKSSGSSRKPSAPVGARSEAPPKLKAPKPPNDVGAATRPLGVAPEAAWSRPGEAWSQWRDGASSCPTPPPPPQPWRPDLSAPNGAIPAATCPAAC
mmetsp:Transcript_49434/g.159572  ORF Transcript_49434/g.159572 Transcript_49434/m.159572 type:complete len:255 (+) Transcript_49434:183-947(+)